MCRKPYAWELLVRDPVCPPVVLRFALSEVLDLQGVDVAILATAMSTTFWIPIASGCIFGFT